MKFKLSSHSKCLLLSYGCLLLLTGCTTRGTEQAETGTADSAPLYARSLEPTLSEAVSRAFNRSCRACHGPAGHGIAAVAPDLRRAKPRSLEQWKQYLTDPLNGHPGAQLSPPTWINTDEIEVLAGYLVNLLPPAAPVAGEMKKAAPKLVVVHKRNAR
jgi:hypothetical protein